MPFDPSEIFTSSFIKQLDFGTRSDLTIHWLPEGSLIVASALRNGAMQIEWTGLTSILNTARANMSEADRVLSIAAGQGGGNLEIVVRADLLAVAAIPPHQSGEH